MEGTPNNPETPVTRRERREQRRLQAREQQGNAAMRRTRRRLLTWGIGLAVIVGIGWLMVRSAADVPVQPSGELAVPVSGEDNVRGPASASVTLVEYSDFQCPACAAYQPIVEKLLAEPELQGKVRFAYRHFPLTGIHRNALSAARFAQAAALQGKFWEMHDALFEAQQEWSDRSAQGAREAFIEYARALGLDTERLAADADGDAVAARVQADIDGGEQAGVNSTPTFFANGARVPQPNSYEEFKQSILAHVAP